MKFAVLTAFAGALLYTAPVRAHHAFAAEFDIKKPVKKPLSSGRLPELAVLVAAIGVF